MAISCVNTSRLLKDLPPSGYDLILYTTDTSLTSPPAATSRAVLHTTPTKRPSPSSGHTPEDEAEYCYLRHRPGPLPHHHRHRRRDLLPLRPTGHFGKKRNDGQRRFRLAWGPQEVGEDPLWSGSAVVGSVLFYVFRCLS